MDHQVDKYSFITLIKEGLNLQHMIIPGEFVKYLNKKSFPRHLILIGPSGDQRQVTCLKKGDDMYIQTGWPRFLKDNMVEQHQLLLFTHEGQNRFHVQIFGTNGCERLLNTKRAGPKEDASTSQMATAASFYQIFIPKFCSERLPIPTDFVKLARLEGTVPKEFILRNCSGRKVWFVEVSCIGSQIYFSGGWKEFASDNCLEESDFIIFKFDGNNNMKFKVLKLYGWEKRGVEDEEMNVEGGNDYMPDIREEESAEEEEDCEMEDQDNRPDDDELSEEHVGGSHHRAGKAPVVDKVVGKTRSYGKNYYTTDAEKYVRSDNPSFTPTLSAYRVNELTVPKLLIQDYSLNLPQKISFLCCEHAGSNSHVRKMNRMATGEKQTSRKGQVMYRGFRKFVRINRIDVEKDKCICEFVLGEDQQIQRLEVHVVKNGLVC